MKNLHVHCVSSSLAAVILAVGAAPTCRADYTVEVPASDQVLYVALEVPSEMHLDPHAAWQLVEMADAPAHTVAQVGPAWKADGRLAPDRHRLLAIIAPRGTGRKTNVPRRFRLTHAGAGGAEAISFADRPPTTNSTAPLAGMVRQEATPAPSTCSVCRRATATATVCWTGATCRPEQIWIAT